LREPGRGEEGEQKGGGNETSDRPDHVLRSHQTAR